jgi:hypothetical protein
MPIIGGAGMYCSLAVLSHVMADLVFIDKIFMATGLLEGQSLHWHVLPNLRSIYLPTLRASVMTSLALTPLQFMFFSILPCPAEGADLEHRQPGLDGGGQL